MAGFGAEPQSLASHSLGFWALDLFFVEIEHEGSCYEPRGEGAEDDADEHDEGEAEDGGAAETDKGDEDEQRGAGSDACSTQRCIEGVVDNRGEISRGFVLHVFSNPIENDDGVIERIADDGHEGCDRIEIDLNGDAEEMKDAK